ncbi:hypothetical protein EVAR_81591_1 [Eumeta japonica]|uniref:Uncharacterized protein n=1 Tax=Eumeta variegata TaxID=151549 RepID=A0A4C1WD65_EUMVA|nr:hypothetical protein EVAR_81591_1 [Eumeta japonica]
MYGPVEETRAASAQAARLGAPRRGDDLPLTRGKTLIYVCLPYTSAAAPGPRSCCRCNLRYVKSRAVEVEPEVVKQRYCDRIFPLKLVCLSITAAAELVYYWSNLNLPSLR